MYFSNKTYKLSLKKTKKFKDFKKTRKIIAISNLYHNFIKTYFQLLSETFEYNKIKAAEKFLDLF